MANVVLKNVKKVYDKNVVAVDDFNLEIDDKEFVVFVGPSGCGKSTTLRMIAGLEDITEGECLIGGTLVNRMAPKDRDIAMVFQNYALYPHMTVYENMAFALKLKKVPKKEREEQIKETAEILGITQYLARKPKALSGGQRQRVAIGRAIVRHPQVFLMDEPLSNLDAKLRSQMRAEIIKLRKRVDTTFIYVTHDQTEAMTLGDRIVVMNDGYIMQTGTPGEVFHHPANMFVAGFIGTPQINFFEGNLLRDGGCFAVNVCGKEFKLAPDRQQAMNEMGIQPQDVTCGVRPENIMIVGEDSPSAITAEVEVSEMMGSEVFVHVKIGGISATAKVSDTDAFNKYPFDMGGLKNVFITFNEYNIHVFNKEGQNIGI
jgi:multiple sugar transport system ATP-binding protein